VEVIGSSAFEDSGCCNGVAFEANSRLLQIEARAFASSRLPRITIPRSVISLGESCFDSCSVLKEVIFESGSKLERLTARVAASCPALERFVIPTSVKDVDGSAFIGVRPGAVLLEHGSQHLRIASSLLLNSSRKQVFACLCDSDKIVIPRSVHALNPKCFLSRRVQEVVFESKSELEQIQESAFESSTLQAICILGPVKTIGEGAFRSCSGLNKVTFERNSQLEIIEKSVFESSALQAICIPNQVKVIREGAFRACSALKAVTFEANSRIETIEKWAFADCSFRYIALPKTLKSFAGNAVQNVPLESISIASDSPYFRILSSYVAGPAGKSIIRYFGPSSVPVVWIPSSIEVICEACFATPLCPPEVRFDPGWRFPAIGPGAFACGRMKRIVIPNCVEVIDNECFQGASVEIVTFEPKCGLVRMGCRAFQKSSIKCITIPASVAVIGDCCFSDSELQDLTFEEGAKLERIGEAAFSSCSMKSVTIPGSVGAIGASGFCSCQSLEKIDFESSSRLAVIASTCFKSSGLKVFIVPNSVTTLKNESFSECPSLYKVMTQCESDLKRIEETCFSKTPLITISLPSAIAFIGNNAIPAHCSIQIIGSVSRELAGWIKRHEKDASIQFERPPSGRSRSLINYVMPEDLSPLVFIRLLSDRDGIRVEIRKHPETSEQFVVKEFKHDQVSAQSQWNFERELEVLIKLNHPCISDLYGVVLPSDTSGPKIVRPFLPNGSLAAVLNAGQQPAWWDSTAKAIVIVGTALAMSEVHAQGFWHRNLIPTNILLDENHYPKLCDFGLSRYEGNSVLTQTHGVGSPLYRPPEIWDPEIPYTNKVDVYSFALIVYEIIVGQHLFAELERSPIKIGLQVSSGRMGVIPESVPANVGSLITTAWSVDPKDRPSFSNILQALKGFGYKIMPDVDTPTVEAFVAWADQSGKC
jgi:hypothetical protein